MRQEKEGDVSPRVPGLVTGGLGHVWFNNFHHSISIIQFPSLITLITHHSKYPTRLAPSLTCHHSIFFILFVGLIPVTRCMKKKKKKKKEKKKRNLDQKEKEEAT